MLKPLSALSFKVKRPDLFSSTTAIEAIETTGAVACLQAGLAARSAAPRPTGRLAYSTHDTRPFMRPARWRRWKSVPPSIATPTSADPHAAFWLCEKHRDITEA